MGTEQGHTVLVTGGSRGIGAAVAERFAAGGYRVVIVYGQSHDAAQRVLERCRELGAAAMAVSADVSSRSAMTAVRDRLESLGMMPDILVNNAGVAHYGLLSDVTDDDWERIMAINLRATFLCTQLFVPRMIRRNFGRIINLSSVWGMVGAACESVYAAAKGGVNAFTKSMAKELAPSGITVNAVAPGAVDTDMMAVFDEEEKRALAEEIPAGRLARPEEIASVVFYLAQPDAGYLTGQIISPSGGWFM